MRFLGISIKSKLVGLFLIGSLFFIAGCAGTGVKNTGLLMPIIESEEESAVLIVRKTGYAGSAALIEVTVDGMVVGELGNEESLAHSVSPGDHSVSVRFKGIASVGMNKVMKTFSVKKGEKAFYSIQQETGLLTNKLTLTGITKDSFIHGN